MYHYIFSSWLCFVLILIYETTILKGLELKKKKKPGAVLGKGYTLEPFCLHWSPLCCLFVTKAEPQPRFPQIPCIWQSPRNAG